MIPIKSDKELETLKRTNEGKLHNARVNCIAGTMYVGCLITIILATYLLWNYCSFLVKDGNKLEIVINQVMTFIFGGSIGGGIFLLRKDK